MKTWKIKLTAVDEESAIVYLDVLKKNFSASVRMKEDMTICDLGNPKKKESLKCVLVKNWWKRLFI